MKDITGISPQYFEEDVNFNKWGKFSGKTSGDSTEIFYGSQTPSPSGGHSQIWDDLGEAGRTLVYSFGSNAHGNQ
jgi:hypothetical protein